MFGLGFVVDLEGGVSGGNQIRLGFDAALAELVVNSPFNALEFLVG